MINAKDAAKRSKIGYEKKFKQTLRELEYDIKQRTREGVNYYYWNGSYVDGVEDEIIDILTSKGYKISKSSNTGMIHIEW